MTLPHEGAFKTLFLTSLLINILEANVCNESLSTVQKVTHCPSNFTELQLAVKRKRCDALANKQNCVSDPKKFVYHCLVNQQNDGFVEVCAPEWILSGFCGYYDTVLDIIVTDVNKDCTKFAYPCPVVFNSSDSYKYQGCYEVRKKEQGTKICDEKGQVHPSTSIDHVQWIVPSVFAIGFFLAFVFVFLKLWKIYYLEGKTKHIHMISSYLPRGQSKEGSDIAVPENGDVCDIGQQIEDQVSFLTESEFDDETDNENQSTSTVTKTGRTASEGNAATEEDTSGKEASFSNRKKNPHTDEETNRRTAYRRQIIENNRERQRRLKGNATSSTPRQKKLNSTFSEITTNSTPNSKPLKSFNTLSDSNLKREGTPSKHQLKHSISETVDSIKGKTGQDGVFKAMNQITTETDCNAATGGDTSEIGEEENFLKKSENIPSSGETKSRKKGNRRKRNKRNKGKEKRNWDYETN